MSNANARFDKLLSDVAVRYRPSGGVHMDAAPRVPVKRTRGSFRTYDRNFRIPETNRARKGLAREHYWDLSTSSYVLENHGLVDYVSQDDKDDFDEIDYRTSTVEELQDKIMMRKEKSLASLLTDTSFSLGVSLAAGQVWTADTSVSNPIVFADTGASTVMANSGVKPNWMIIPRASYVAAKNHSFVIDRVKHTSREMNENILAALLGVEKVLVPHISEDTADRNLASSISDIYTTDFVLMGYSPANPGPKVISTFYRFEKNITPVRTWIEDRREGAEAIEVSSKHQFKVVASLTGYYIDNAV